MATDETLSAHLHLLSAGEREHARRHPLVVRTADGSLPQQVFERWLLINADFLRTYRRFMMVMGTAAPDTRSSKLMFSGLQSIDHEMADVEDFVVRRALAPSSPSPRAMDYTSYVMASSAQGWTRGLIVAYAVEDLFYDAWASVRDKISNDNPYRPFVDAWTNEDQRQYVLGLQALVDALPNSPETERIFRTVLHFEISSWDEAFEPAHP
ncbi:MAG: hypothetical protein ACR2KL_02170 [Nocardioidaceae bacterium]